MARRPHVCQSLYCLDTAGGDLGVTFSCRSVLPERMSVLCEHWKDILSWQVKVKPMASTRNIYFHGSAIETANKFNEG